jgi:Zn-dependent protease
MIFAEPPRTRFDIHFRLLRMPVRIHPFFWVSSIGLALRPNATLVGVAVWVVAVFLSILVHELGHAMAFRHFGHRPRITLYGFGGLASADDEPSARRLVGTTRIIISAAGPLAGFALGAATLVVVLALGYQTPFLRWTLGTGAPIERADVSLFVFDLLFINFVWGLVNLLPVHPLDGGQIALEVVRTRDPARGVERSVWISLVTAIAAAIVGLVVLDSLWVALLFGYLAFVSARLLRRQYGVSFHGRRVVRWMGQRWRSWRRARRRRAIGLSVVRELRKLEELEDREPTAEADRIVSDLLRSTTERASSTGTGGPREGPGQ